jgi:hypothetical protein
VWVLNAMYEHDDMPAGLTHHELRQQAIAAGLEEPEIVGGVNLDEATVTTGGGLGFQEKPPSPWRRRTRSELGRRQGFGFWAVDEIDPVIRFIAAVYPDPGLRSLDSIHLATVQTAAATAPLTALVTYDSRLSEAADALGMTIVVAPDKTP